jgi:predicted RNA-binding protein (virulence factor B family)
MVDRLTDHGLFLSSNKDDYDVLLPNAYVKPYMQIGSVIEVFIYNDSEDRVVATTQTPKVMFDEFTVLEVVDECKFGVFLDWGLPKDLLLHKKEQSQNPQIGDKIAIYLGIDKKTDRLFATQKIDQHLSKDSFSLKKGQEVKIIVYNQTDLGFKCIVDNNFEGLIFKNEVFENFQVSDERIAYIKNIRQDGKLDISLQPIANQNQKDDIYEQKIISILKKNNNSSTLNSKSEADDIYKEFAVSKKVFKRTINTLKEKNILDINENGIKLK